MRRISRSLFLSFWVYWSLTNITPPNWRNTQLNGKVTPFYHWPSDLQWLEYTRLTLDVRFVSQRHSMTTKEVKCIAECLLCTDSWSHQANLSSIKKITTKENTPLKETVSHLVTLESGVVLTCSFSLGLSVYVCMCVYQKLKKAVLRPLDIKHLSQNSTPRGENLAEQWLSKN